MDSMEFYLRASEVSGVGFPVLWARVVLITSRFIQGFVHGQWHRFIFVISTLVYAAFYQDFQQHVISLVYQHDKYGVVINYGLLVFLELWVLGSRLRLQRASNRRSKGVQEFMEGFFNLHVALSVFKILLFNFIFKNHTDDTALRKRLHVICVILLGIVTLFHNFIKYCVSPSKNIELLRFGIELLPLIVFGAAFKFFQWYAEIVSLQSRWRNFFTTLFEALLIQQTM